MRPLKKLFNSQVNENYSLKMKKLKQINFFLFKFKKALTVKDLLDNNCSNANVNNSMLVVIQINFKRVWLTSF